MQPSEPLVINTALICESTSIQTARRAIVETAARAGRGRPIKRRSRISVVTASATLPVRLRRLQLTTRWLPICRTHGKRQSKGRILSV